MPGRFAPTPSGRMHIGNIYAMLGAWLSARSSNDAIYLRIEDIDEPRVVPGAADLIMDDLQWLGLDWDGAPVYQSARHPLYEDALRALQRLTIDDSGAVTADATGNATPLIYPCFCSRADIRAASAPQEGDRFMIYPGTCRRLAETNPDEVRARLAQGRRHSLRIAMPASNSTIAFEDRVFGHQEFNVTREIGDSVVRRADGLFSYQLVVVVDDLAMGVDDIVRGRDLLRSNALQIWIRQALTGSTDYSYAHLPLIDNASGQRLAKREKSLDMGILRKHGVTPERVIGYCAWLLGLQGDPHSTHPQPMSVQEALTEFSWAKVRTDTADRSLDPQAFNTYFGL
ncbi:glutamyl-Q tRNA(Asp) synthetase [Bifidobacterium dentium]|uniref:glutamyl-Q tRNA(Asp) synthetase n=1 Tax=Bifidobacterium dentium TaxID=1689 RepID=UPI0018B05E7D|nr:glutamyl-Q tRNA(Asp) synthetase [Bifidobacterium dentium]MBF9694980.1 glutamyl-Q tRNA(Asp) synthetase [Bifidobacterium dentium]